MKIEKFNEPIDEKSTTTYKLFVYVGDSETTITNEHITSKDALDELRELVLNGLPGTDGNTYHIHDAYIEKTSRVKIDEVKMLIDSKKYNL